MGPVIAFVLVFGAIMVAMNSGSHDRGSDYSPSPTADRADGVRRDKDTVYVYISGPPRDPVKKSTCIAGLLVVASAGFGLIAFTLHKRSRK